MCRCAWSGRCVGVLRMAMCMVYERGIYVGLMVRDIVWCLGWPHGPCVCDVLPSGRYS